MVAEQGINKRIKTYQSAQVIPDLRNVRIEADGTGVGVERIAVLIDLIIQDTNRAPKSRVLSITVHGLLVGFVGLGIFLLGHVATTQQIPALGILIIWNVMSGLRERRMS